MARLTPRARSDGSPSSTLTGTTAAIPISRETRNGPCADAATRAATTAPMPPIVSCASDSCPA